VIEERIQLSFGSKSLRDAPQCGWFVRWNPARRAVRLDRIQVYPAIESHRGPEEVSLNESRAVLEQSDCFIDVQHLTPELYCTR